MDEKDFDKLFSQKMRAAAAPDFSDEDWQPLSQQLDGWQRRRWRILPLWWLAALSGVLLLSNVIWWFTWRESNEQLSRLLEQMPQLTEKQSVVLYDTIYRTVVVHQRDTLYRTLVLQPVSGAGQTEKAGTLASESQQANDNEIARSKTLDHTGSMEKNAVSLNPSPKEASALAGNAPASPGVPSATPKNQVVTSADNTHPVTENDSGAISEAEIAQMQASDAFLSPLPLKHAKEIKRLPHPPIPLPFLADWETAKPDPPRPFPLTPKTFRLGLGGGLALPGAAVIASKSGTSIGVKGDIGFSDQLSLAFEGTFNKLKFQGYVYDESLGLPLPNPPGIDYNFKYFETHDAAKPMFQLTMAMRYRFNAAKKLSPVLGAGFATQWHPEYILEYEYTHQASGNEFSESVEVEDLDKPLSFLHFEFGLNYKIAKRWELQASGFYDVEATKKQLGIPRFYGLKTFLLYEF